MKNIACYPKYRNSNQALHPTLKHLLRVAYELLNRFLNTELEPCKTVMTSMAEICTGRSSLLTLNRDPKAGSLTASQGCVPLRLRALDIITISQVAHI